MGYILQEIAPSASRRSPSGRPLHFLASGEVRCDGRAAKWTQAHQCQSHSQSLHLPNCNHMHPTGYISKLSKQAKRELSQFFQRAGNFSFISLSLAHLQFKRYWTTVVFAWKYICRKYVQLGTLIFRPNLKVKQFFIKNVYHFVVLHI